ncbi:hypothetical protein LIER_40609 [Lithospermum erythrorhizon]|uniref:WAT1-related protein n=1 Tax=Lithospermum erythrorhizon TaxID=34254 RepID=A0AAV3QYA3_LITER
MGQPTSKSTKLYLVLALLALQLCFTGFHIVSKFALDMGISMVVYPIYRNILALLILGPVAYLFEKNDRPPLTFRLLVEFVLLALLGVTALQGFYILGLYYGSPTLVAAIQNSVPAITFLMAVAMRLEKLNFVRTDGLAKISGTVVCVGGATIITLYRGPSLKLPFIQPLISNTEADETETVQNWTLGSLYILAQCVSWSAWMVFQAPVVKRYPAPLSLTSFTCFFGLIQLLVIAAFCERELDHWIISSYEEIFTIAYAGIVASGVIIALQIWCIHNGGPVYVAVFQPLQTVLVAIASYLIFGDQIYTGGILGAAFIIAGLYLVLWGKTKELKVEARNTEGSLTTHLLQGNSEDRGTSATAAAATPVTVGSAAVGTDIP